jgi:hypothetical protein
MPRSTRQRPKEACHVDEQARHRANSARAVATSLHEHWVFFLVEGIILVIQMAERSNSDRSYRAPAGWRNDSLTAAISHRERDGKIVLDVLYERRSQFNPSEVVAEIVALMRQYRCQD